MKTFRTANDFNFYCYVLASIDVLGSNSLTTNYVLKFECKNIFDYIDLFKFFTINLLFFI